MRQHLSVIALAVKDLDAAFKFYHHGLGLKSQGMIGTEFEYGAVAFLDLQQGLKLALWPQNSLSHDTGLEKTAFCSTQMSLGHNVSNPAEVDRLIASHTRRRQSNKTRAAYVLRRLFRLLSRPRWISMGDYLQSAIQLKKYLIRQSRLI